MMHGKTIWKPGIGGIAKVSRGIAPGPHNSAYEVRWVMAYGHKSQSFMKNGG